MDSVLRHSISPLLLFQVLLSMRMSLADKVLWMDSVHSLQMSSFKNASEITKWLWHSLDLPRCLLPPMPSVSVCKILQIHRHWIHGVWPWRAKQVSYSIHLTCGRFKMALFSLRLCRHLAIVRRHGTGRRFRSCFSHEKKGRRHTFNTFYLTVNQMTCCWPGVSESWMKLISGHWNWVL